MRLYLWDDAKILRKNTHFKYFDEVMSFNMDECKKYGFKYMPMFTQHEWIGHAKQNKYDLALIGTAHPDRIKLAKEIYEMEPELTPATLECGVFQSKKPELDLLGVGIPYYYQHSPAEYALVSETATSWKKLLRFLAALGRGV